MNDVAATRHALQVRLRIVALRLLARRVARAVVHGVIAGSAVALLAVAALVVLPVLFGAGLADGPLLAAAAGILGFVFGMLREIGSAPIPGMKEAALALEARLEHSNGSLATAIDLAGGEFEKPVLARATDALKDASARPGPHVLGVRSLMLAPLLALCAATAFLWAYGLEAPADTGGMGPGVQPPTSAFSVDVPSGRSAEDRAALARALGLRHAAEAMRTAAQTVRSEAALQEQRQQALEQARQAAAESADAELQRGTEELSDIVPSRREERELLATRLENLAMGAGERAGESPGTTDTGREGELESSGTSTGFVPFPRFALKPEGESAALVAQPPERRALARRAMQELEQQ